MRLDARIISLTGFTSCGLTKKRIQAHRLGCLPIPCQRTRNAKSALECAFLRMGYISFFQRTFFYRKVLHFHLPACFAKESIHLTWHKMPFSMRSGGDGGPIGLPSPSCTRYKGVSGRELSCSLSCAGDAAQQRRVFCLSPATESVSIRHADCVTTNVGRRSSGTGREHRVAECALIVCNTYTQRFPIIYSTCGPIFRPLSLQIISRSSVSACIPIRETHRELSVCSSRRTACLC